MDRAKNRPSTEGLESRLSRYYAFECSEHFHLATLCPSAAYIYGLAYKLTKQGKELLFPSAASLADYFACSEDTIRRGLKALVGLGFLELTQADPFQTNVYRVLSHTEWAKEHPEQCCTRLKFPYTDEGDPLGQRLYLATGGRVRFQQFQVDGYRKLGLSDDEILVRFGKFWGEKGHALDVRIVSRYFHKILQVAA